MINLIEKNNKLNSNVNSLNVTYSRTVNILFGNYPYPEKIHNFILEIKNNLDPKMKNYTNVKGGMTNWDFFKNKKEFNDFIIYLINKHQNSHPHIFEYFLEKYFIENAWGNEIKKEDSLDYHHHNNLHGILYLTKGCDLKLPELNLKITPEPGDYYIFPALVLHGFEKTKEENNRYSLVFNIGKNDNSFDFYKKIENINKRL